MICCPYNHLSFQNKVLAPSPITDSTAMAKERTQSCT
uniref:Uncharacterized protein n=1 Tax=Arundo donax TaxID=35708 RepID=A0A0A9AYT3_ARUDO